MELQSTPCQMCHESGRSYQGSDSGKVIAGPLELQREQGTASWGFFHWQQSVPSGEMLGGRMFPVPQICGFRSSHACGAGKAKY